jgi:hypothetical protein
VTGSCNASQMDPSQMDPSQMDPSQMDPSQMDPSQMDPSPGGSAALVISVHIDVVAPTRWFARVLSYRDAHQGAYSAQILASVDEICALVRSWLNAVTE